MLKYLKSDLTEARGIIVIWAVLEINECPSNIYWNISVRLNRKVKRAG